VPGSENERDQQAEKAERRAARDMIVAYHQAQLRALLEHVRSGFAQLDAGDIDEFELDDLIFHYKKSAAKLWSFCDSSGRRSLGAASALTYLREEGREPDWWAAGGTRRERSS
jgi:hypothetical protein